MRIVRLALLGVLVGWLMPASTEAASIVSPTAITANSMGTFPCCGYTDEGMINGSGLVTPFTSGVDDFDLYFASNPQHTVESFCCEWFSPDDVLSGSVTFDLGSLHRVDRLAVWADEYAGFGLTNVFTSIDGVAFVAVGSFTPTNHSSLDEGGAVTYGADIAVLTTTDARYVRFDITGPQTPREYEGLGIGEVAFSATPVPEPGTLLLLGGGLAVGVARRLRRRS